ncbi:hypothetical protein Tco_0037832 [Tanacetum coccineum]
MHADLKYVESLEMELDELESELRKKFSTYEITELQCLYLYKVRKCDCLAQKLSEQTEFIVQLILFIVDSGCTKHMTGNLSLLCNFVEKILGYVRIGMINLSILGYGVLVKGNISTRKGLLRRRSHHIFSRLVNSVMRIWRFAFRKSMFCMMRSKEDHQRRLCNDPLQGLFPNEKGVR